MDPISSNSTSDGTSIKVHLTKVTVANTPSSTSNVASANADASNVIPKHVIRRITPLDLQQLQQAGLDRKIAEALSKQKTDQKNKILNRPAGQLNGADSSTEAITPTISKSSNVQEAKSAANKPVIPNIRKPPKITITGPDVLSDVEKQQLAHLDSHERLVHVKNLLNKKILHKGGTEIDHNEKSNQHLKLPTSLSNSQQYKLVKKVPQGKSGPPTKFYDVLKEPSEVLENTNSQTNAGNMRTIPKKKVTATKSFASTLKNLRCIIPTQTETPQKSPQDIARKQDFQIKGATTAAHAGKQQHFKTVKQIPKTSVKVCKLQQQNKPLPVNATPGDDVLLAKQSYYVTNTSKKKTDFQTEYIKQQKNNYRAEIPKASIQTSQTKEQCSSLPFSSKQPQRSKPKLDFPEDSQLKVIVPKVNVPKETAFSTKGSLKKPYPMADSTYYGPQNKTADQTDFIHTNYETSLFKKEPTTPLVTTTTTTTKTKTNFVNNAATTSTLANSLIVLENKILSQEEMIDLTELRLSTSKFDTPRFITAHRPIPEVVIKQENTDEYPLTDISTQKQAAKGIQRQNKDNVSTDRLTVSNKRNKRIIINAQKLKFTPEQLAELAKKMKQTTSTTLQVKEEINQANKPILNTNVASGQTATKHTTCVLPHNTENINQTAKEIPDKFIIKNKPLHSDVPKYNYQYKKTEQDFKTIGGNNNFITGQPNAMNATPIEPNYQSYFDKSLNESKITQKILDVTTSYEISENSGGIKHDHKSAVEIVDEPLEAEDCFSAVDFIFALSNTNPITEEKSLELSPEELNLNASCSKNLSPIRIQAAHPQGIKTQAIRTFNLGDPELVDNLAVCDIEMEISTETLITKANPKKRDVLLQNITTEENNCSSEFINVFKPDANPKNISQNVKNSKALMKFYTKEINDETATLKPSANEVPTSVNDITKLPQEIETSKTSERNSNTTVATKRISKFKKGKINLVQRNKASQATKKTLLEDKKIVVNKSSNETFNSEDKIDFENKIDETQDELHKRSKETLIDLYNERFTVPTQINIMKPEHYKPTMNCKQNEGKIKETQLVEPNAFHVTEIIENTLLTPGITSHNDIDENNIDETRDELHKKSEEALIDLYNEMFTVPTQTNILKPEHDKPTMSCNLNEGNIKETQLVETNASHVAEIIDNALLIPKVTSQNVIDENKIDETRDALHNKSKETLIKVYNEMFSVPTETKIIIPEKDKRTMSSNQSEGHIEESNLLETDIIDNVLLTPGVTSHNAIVERGTINSLTEIQVSTLGKEIFPKESNIKKKSTEKVDFPSNLTSTLDITINRSLECDITNIPNSTEITPKKVTVTKQIEQSNKLQDEIQTTQSCAEIFTCRTPESVIENLNPKSKSILKTMKTATISLIDIVKHSPIKSPESNPEVPFKKSCHEKSINSKTAKESLLKLEEQKVQANKCVSRPGSRNQTVTLPLTASTRKRHSARPLISDDDLEFLPENVDVKFNISQSIQNKRNNDRNQERDLTSEPHERRQSLYSKPLELALFNTPSSSLTRRSRYYSQTLETNVTVTFDTLKSQANLSKNLKPLETKESYNVSTKNPCTISPTKQRKKLRKTLVDVKETQKSHNDTDSDDDNRHYDCVMRDCEANNEFLGFEDNSESVNFENTQHVVEENDHEAKTKHGTLKNWLTTGKAISPTLDKQSNRQFRRDDAITELATSTPVIRDTTEQKPFKKKWNLCTYDETDITDDTSAADDEEIGEQISIEKKFKRGIKNVIDSNKELLDSKKKKLDDSIEQIFVKPQHIAKVKSEKSGTDLYCHEEKAGKSQNLSVSITNLEETQSESQEIPKATKSGIRKKNFGKDKEITGTESDCHLQKHLKSNRFQVNTEQSETDADWQECGQSMHHKSKDKSNTIENANERSEGNETHGAGSDCYDGIKSVQVKYEVDNKNIDKASSGNVEKKLSIECAKWKRRRNSKSIQNDKEENLDIPQQQEIIIKSENSNDKNITESSEGEHSDLLITPIAISRDKAEPRNFFITTQNLTHKRKRGRPKKPVISESSEDEGPSTSTGRRTIKAPTKGKPEIDDSYSDTLSKSLKKTPITTSRCRKIKNTIESNFNPRLLLITKRDQLDTDEIITETKTQSGSIQCGLCLKRTQSAKWAMHLAEHYGVGWKVGEEKLNIENRSVVLSTILKYMKVTGSIGLTCRMCKKVYRSALGILGHIEICGGEPPRVVCEFCKREYAKLSLTTHMRICFARNPVQNQSADESNQEKVEIIGNSGRLKRNSTIKAENKLKALGAELEEVTDDMKADIDPKLRIKYVAPKVEDFIAKWSKDIKELGKAYCPKSRCKFTSSDIKELSGHLKECKFIKSGHVCNFCRRVFQSQMEAIAHVRKSHLKRRSESNDSDCDLKTADEHSSDDDNYLSEDVDENELTDGMVEEEEDVEDFNDNKKDGKRQKSKSINNRNLSQTSTNITRKQVFNGRHYDLDKEVLKKWNMFLKSNYSCEPLYIECTSKYSVINHQEFNKYLPTQTVSMKYSFGTKNTLISKIGLPQNKIEWSELKRYESIHNKMNTYFFLGAPIKVCSWLPLPAYVNEQYLAVIYRYEMIKFIKFTKPKQHPSIVLILKVTRNNEIPEINIHYGFIVNDGPVHHLSFLPSGGYDESSNRLGLIAVATVNSCINIYSLPLNVELDSTQDHSSSKDNVTLVAVKPSFILNLEIRDQKDEQQHHVLLNPQCLQICWSEYSGHQHIFAGFSNGFVGIWEIVNDPEQNLNHFVVDHIINYAPLNYFYVGEKCVKLAVHYDTSGPRWLAVSSAYRKFIIYDIKNLTQPIIMKEDANKNIMLSLHWCPVWETVLCTYCDALQNFGRLLIAISPNNMTFTHNRIDVMPCGITQVHYTPVTNVCVTASSSGDIVFLNTRELHYDIALSRKFGPRRTLYAMDIKQLNGEPLVRLGKGDKNNDDTPSDWTMNDANYKEKYGLIFEPLVKIKENDRKMYTDENRAPPVNMIPLMRINTLRCNTNQNGKDLIALGYENGFLRLVNFNKKKFFGN